MNELTIALAAVFQAGSLADELANSGAVRDLDSWHVSLDSLYKIDATDTRDVFNNNIAGLSLGLNNMIKALNKDPHFMPVLKYSLTLLALQPKLMAHPKHLETIQKGILDSKALRAPDDRYPQAVITKLANIYSGTVSLLQPRVIITGKPYHLKQPHVTEKIRATLLAGIRAAVLWRQLGGKQWQLLFKRKAYIEQAKKLLVV